ncbi:hypothetical protein KY285_007935 [Solanum tuberosum]|nr:hypothetical protein KY285_007935 [Solanum tuberosum]
MESWSPLEAFAGNQSVFKKESPSPVEVEPGDLFLLKYGKRKKKQSITGKEIEKEMESQQERRLGEIAYFPFLGFLPADD